MQYAITHSLEGVRPEPDHRATAITHAHTHMGGGGGVLISTNENLLKSVTIKCNKINTAVLFCV